MHIHKNTKFIFTKSNYSQDSIFMRNEVLDEQSVREFTKQMVSYAQIILTKFFRVEFAGQVWSAVVHNVTVASKTCNKSTSSGHLTQHWCVVWSTRWHTCIHALHTNIHTYMHSYTHTYIFFNSDGALAQGSDFALHRKGTSCLPLFTRIQTRASHETTLQQTECPLTNRLSSPRSSLKPNLNSRPYDERVFSPPDAAFGFGSPRAIHILVV